MLEPGPVVSDMYSTTPAQAVALQPQDRWEQTLHWCSRHGHWPGSFSQKEPDEAPEEVEREQGSDSRMHLTNFLPSSRKTHSTQFQGSLAEPQQETLEAGRHVHDSLREKDGDQVGVQAGRTTSQRAIMDRLFRTGDHREDPLQDPRKARPAWALYRVQMREKDWMVTVPVVIDAARTVRAEARQRWGLPYRHTQSYRSHSFSSSCSQITTCLFLVCLKQEISDILCYLLHLRDLWSATSCEVLPPVKCYLQKGCCWSLQSPPAKVNSACPSPGLLVGPWVRGLVPRRKRKTWKREENNSTPSHVCLHWKPVLEWSCPSPPGTCSPDPRYGHSGGRGCACNGRNPLLVIKLVKSVKAVSDSLCVLHLV